MREKLQRDISPRLFWLAVALIFAIKFGISCFQNIYVWVDGAPIDDELMFRAAQSITAGQWLGGYDWLTLSKHMLFPVWLAFCHAIHLPYLGANQLLWCAASLAMAKAFAPVIKQYKAQLGLFALLAFLPTSTASFTLRVYRDSIYPSLCLLFFAGVVGYALRCTGKVHSALGWQALAGLGMAASWLCREDGYWVAPFALVGGGFVAWQVICTKGLNKKPLRLAGLLLPFGVLAACLGVFCTLNMEYYGVFCISDFSSGSFADAMGAMNRVQEDEYIPLVTVPVDVREKIYAATDEMDILRPYLEEDEAMLASYGKNGDYQAGGYYWAVRKAAYLAGVYTSAENAARYWQWVADEINTACDNGALPAESGKRSGTTPPIRSEYVLPVLGETAHSLVFALTFRDCEAYYADQRSIGTAQDLAVYESYLGNRCNAAAQAGSDLPYYSPYQKLVYWGLNLLRWSYALLLPVAFLAAAVLQICKAKVLLKKGSTPVQTLCWWVLLGLLGMGLLRLALIAFMEVAAFHIGTYVMYLATVHPLLAVYAFGGVATGWEARPWQK